MRITWDISKGFLSLFPSVSYLGIQLVCRDDTSLPFQRGCTAGSFQGRFCFSFLSGTSFNWDIPHHVIAVVLYAKKEACLFQKALQKYSENLGLCVYYWFPLVTSCNLLRAAYIGYVCPVRISLLPSFLLFKIYAFKRLGYMITNFFNPELLEAEGPQITRLN